jgi:outer membrane protein, heavy metal efflux system
MKGMYMKYLLISSAVVVLGGCATSPNYQAQIAEREVRVATPPKSGELQIASSHSNSSSVDADTRNGGGSDHLREYIHTAIDKNAGLRASFDKWAAAMEKIPQVTSLPDPQFTWTYFVEEVQTRTGPQNSRYTLAQKFPWFGKLKLQGEATAFAAESLWWEVEAAKLRVIRDVKNAYFEYAYLNHAIKIMEENLSLLKTFEPIVQRSIQVGGGQGDLIRLQVEIGKIENDLATLQDFRAPVSARLRAVLNMDGTDPLPWPSLDPGEAISYSRDDILDRFNRMNPQLQSLMQRVHQSETLKERARLEGYPDFSLGLSYIDTGSAVTATKPSDSGTDPWAFTVGVSIPIWRQKVKAGIREAEFTEAASNRRLHQKRYDLLSELELRTYEIDDAARQVELYQGTLIPRARQALEVTEISYESGNAVFLDIIDVQRELLAFEKAYWRFVATHKQRIADLEMLVGGPMP